jgi:D-alanyl-D-alanine carboxypeptidase
MNRIFLFAVITIVVFYFYSCGTKVKSPEKADLANQKNNPESVQSDSRQVAESSSNSEEIISKSYLMGQFDPSKDERFIQIPKEYLEDDTKVTHLRKEVFDKFIELYNAAKKDGIIFKIVSATRPFDAQKSIWERKWTGKQKVDGVFLSKEMNSKEKAEKILKYSSMPGTSRHHWGTDIDLNSVENEYWETAQGKKEYNWLMKHANEYGFCQVYSTKGKDRPTGYEEEKWHWSYMPISKLLTEAYKREIKNSDIKGFLGAENAEGIDMINYYVLGINEECK